MKRRSFLQSSSFISIPMLLNGLPLSAVGKNAMFDLVDEDNDKVLVLIQLNGGNDGLNTIIPLDHYDLLANVRSNIIIPENQILKIDDENGFHPSLGELQSIYDDGKMTLIKDVGYPNQNRSHFRSLDIWTSGSPADESWTTGWLGRYMEDLAPEYPEGYPNEDNPDPFALTIGSSVSETCQGTISNFSLAIADPISLNALSVSGDTMPPDNPYGKELEFIRTTIAQSNAYGSVITEAADKGNTLSNLYPESNLASQLRNIALLISGGLKTKVYIANLGGFDTHANQVEAGDVRVGDHATLLTTISEAVAAFQDDLSQLGLEEKVVTMTFSEFGRRIRSNVSLGTDHGSAAPMMVFGSCVNAGILGNKTALPDNPSQSDGVPFQFDFRDIYGSLLMDWFGVEEGQVRQILHDDFVYVPIVSKCNTTTPIKDVPIFVTETYAYPNPFTNWTTIQLNSEGGPTRIALYDAMGRQLKVLMDQDLRFGEHNIKVETSDLQSGNYFCRVITEAGVQAISLVKA